MRSSVAIERTICQLSLTLCRSGKKLSGGLERVQPHMPGLMDLGCFELNICPPDSVPEVEPSVASVKPNKTTKFH